MPRRLLRSQVGSALLEAVIGSAVLAIVALGTLPLLEAMGAQSGATRDRGVSSSLAQSDLERMRSMDVRDLSNHSRTETVTVGQLRYEVRSETEWVRDASGTMSCSADAGVDYLRIRSRVRPLSAGARSVTMESLVSPPVGSFSLGNGTLAVKVTDGAGRPVTGLTVSAGGGAVATNAGGCAVLGMLPAGQHTVTFSTPGWVQPNGDEQVSHTASVVAGATSTASYQYDQAGSAVVAFDTRLTAASSVTPAAWPSASVAHASLSGDRTFTEAAAVSSVEGTGLFPFQSAYAAFAGGCSGNDPTAYAPDYFTTAPGSTTVPAGGVAPSVTVRMPALWILATRGGTAHPAARVTIRTTLAGCTETVPVQTPDANAEVKVPLPFGTYALCASDANGRRATTTVTNATPDGLAAPIVLDIPTSGSTPGACPA